MPRLFTAIELGDAVRDALARAQRTLADDVDPAHHDLRLMPAAQFHVTLVFLGDVPAPAVDAVASALRAPIPLAPFSIAFGGPGTFPERGAPRVLWMGLAEGVPALTRLFGLVRDRLVDAGAAIESRPFRPHITLGRWRAGGSPRRMPVLPPVGSVPPQMVRAVTLFESRLHPRGAEHVVLQRTSLAGDGSALH